MIHAYNRTKHNSTGFSPYYLMFGHKPRLPVDVILQTEVDPQHSTHRQYLQNWKEVMEDAYAGVLQNSTYRKEHDKERTLQVRQIRTKRQSIGQKLDTKRWSWKA